MPTLSNDRIAALLLPYLEPSANAVPPTLTPQLSLFLDLLLRWNARTNLTAIRGPEEIVQRHFGESLFTARHLAARLASGATLLDFGSGAGFPGIPIQLDQPSFLVTLAESQGKKAAFLHEAVRTLGLETKVWANRVEAMPAGQTFDCVMLRAVDRMEDALKAAIERVAPGGILAVLGDAAALPNLSSWMHETFNMPQTTQTQLHLYTRKPIRDE